MNESNPEINIDLKEFLLLVSNRKYHIAIFTVLITLLAIWFALKLPNVYESSVVYRINDDDSNNFNLAGAAALLGGGNTNQSIEKFRPILESNDLLINFIEKENLLKSFYPDLVDTINGEWISGLPTDEIPVVEDAIKVFREKFLILDLELGNNLFQIKMRHTNPEKAKEWVQLFTESFLNRIEELDRATSEQTLEFYRSKLKETVNPDHKKALINLISDETKQSILLGRNKFQMIDSAKLPRKKVAPSRLIIVVLSGIIALCLAIGTILLNFLLKQIFRSE